jgi:hypothetical protein
MTTGSLAAKVPGAVNKVMDRGEQAPAAKVSAPSIPPSRTGGSAFMPVARPPVILSPTCPHSSPLATLQEQGVARAQAYLKQLGGHSLSAAEQAPFHQGVGDGNWCGMFAGTCLGLKQDARVGLASTSRALGFFTQPGSGRQLFILDGTDTAGKQWTDWSATQNGLPTQRYTSQNLPIRPGDVVIFDDGFRGGTGHIGLVASYTPPMLTTIEGNVDGGQIKTYTYDLSDPKVAAQIDGFGRPALSDFDVPAQPRGRVIQPS